MYITKLFTILAIAVFVHVINVANADCDRAGMCRKIVNMIEQDLDTCQGQEDCIKPGVVDCLNDMAIFNHFNCNAADCVYVQAKLKSGVGATEATCNDYFPQVVGTKFEREPFVVQQGGLGPKTSPHGLYGVGGH